MLSCCCQPALAQSLSRCLPSLSRCLLPVFAVHSTAPCATFWNLRSWFTSYFLNVHISVSLILFWTLVIFLKFMVILQIQIGPLTFPSCLLPNCKPHALSLSISLFSFKITVLFTSFFI